MNNQVVCFISLQGSCLTVDKKIFYEILGSSTEQLANYLVGYDAKIRELAKVVLRSKFY